MNSIDRNGLRGLDQQELRQLEQKCTQESPPACTAACPLHVDGRAFLQAIQREEFAAANSLLQKRQPFPGIISRICEHPCQNSCKREEKGGAIALGALERYCVSNYLVAPLRPVAVKPKQQQVAVIGGGLSGLTAAWELSKKGYSVVIFEAEPELGGHLLSLSEEVLPKQVIESELAVLWQNGVQIRCNTCIGRELSLTQVQKDFDAVYLAIGSKGTVPAEMLGAEGKVGIDSVSYITVLPGVFAGGSIRTGRISFVHSAADGRRAAISIDRYLQQASLTAARENEGEYVTNLFVNTQGVPSVETVAMSAPVQGFSREEAVAEARRCLDCQCLECVKACKYLESFGGYPKKYLREIYNNESIVMGRHQANKLINSCSLCGQCAEVCPNHLDMGEVIKKVRQKMTERSKMPPSAHDFALRDMEFSNSDLFSLARHQPGTVASRYVFFPGCQLSASSPDQVERVYAYLHQNLAGGVGLMLRCCSAPAEWAGREDLRRQAEEEMNKEWQEMGQPILITACSTCYATFQPKFPQVVSLWEIMRSQGLPEERKLAKKLAIHDACSTRHEEQIHGAVREIIQQLGCEIEELPYNRETTKCCGYGGLMWSANRELSLKVAAERTGESPTDYVVYCAMCRDSFADQGKSTVHILDLLFASDPFQRAGQKGPGFSERHENRARLKQRLLHELWQEENPVERGYMTIKLVFEDNLIELLEERRILLEDVQKVIEYAEQTDRKFSNNSNDHYLAYYKPASVTYWVEYSRQEDGFYVYNAYCHRMEIVEDGKA
ncbi:MAG: pyridine nucleotide-disulfide oxidoreductase/dicluster-binding protein [Desulfitobacteriaceae bacterium]